MLRRSGGTAACSQRPELGSAIVSRGGRPCLAGDVLPCLKAPTLLIVGGRDFQVVEMNREALARIDAMKELVIIPGATHLFEEPGPPEEVAGLAADRSSGHLRRGAGE